MVMKQQCASLDDELNGSEEITRTHWFGHVMGLIYNNRFSLNNQLTGTFIFSKH